MWEIMPFATVQTYSEKKILMLVKKTCIAIYF